MTDNASANHKPNRLFSFSLNRPFTAVILLFLLACLFKILDSFILRWDELVGEAILTKTLGFLLVVGFLWISGKRLKDIGFHKRNVGKALLLAAVSFSGVYALMFIAQLIALRSSGEAAKLALTAVDPKTGMTGGCLFGLWLVFTNLINSAMEEGLFRGLMIRHLRIKSSPWGAILISAALFSIWHISWPIRRLLDGAATLGEAGFEAFGLMLATFIAGIVYGVLYHKTDNLWAPFLAHTINNTLLNIVYYQTEAGLQSATGFTLFQILLLAGNLALIPIILFFSKRLNLPESKIWGEVG
jgi:membrane protease YdiL (CAAX protease family)